MIDDTARSFRVSQAAFTDPDTFRAELRDLFGRVWLYVGHASEVPGPGDVVARRLAGREVLLLNDAGTMRVLRNRCAHRGATVGAHGRHLRCPYHGWVYRLDGRLARVPGREAYGGLPPGRLVELPLASHRDLLFTAFGEVGSLDEHLGPVREYLDLVLDAAERWELVAGTQVYRVRANWKLAADNGVDVLHVGQFHRRFLDALVARGAELVVRQGEHGWSAGLAGGHGVVEYAAPWGRLNAQWNPVLGESARPGVEASRAELERRLGPERAARVADLSRNLLVFPNLVVNDLSVLTVRTYEPVAVDAVELRATCLAPVGEDAATRAARLRAFNDLLGPAGFGQADDAAIVEACQRGMDPFEPGWSDYSRGLGREPNTASDEAAMRGFWREWARRT